MLIVTGSLTARADNVDLFTRESLAHVRRSRLEDGCLHHSVARDCENPHRFAFFEKWRDRAALDAHFALPETMAFFILIRRDAESWDRPGVYEIAE